MNWLMRAYILAALLTFDARIVVHIEGAHNSASDLGRPTWRWAFIFPTDPWRCASPVTVSTQTVTKVDNVSDTTCGRIDSRKIPISVLGSD
jgi:hypothetical protein